MKAVNLLPNDVRGAAKPTAETAAPVAKGGAGPFVVLGTEVGPPQRGGQGQSEQGRQDQRDGYVVSFGADADVDHRLAEHDDDQRACRSVKCEGEIENRPCGLMTSGDRAGTASAATHSP